MQCEEWADANSELFKEAHDEAVHKNSYKSRLYELISASLRKGTEMPFHIEQVLEIAGGYMEEGALYRSHVVKDRELITGQNPASDMALAKALAEALDKRQDFY